MKQSDIVKKIRKLGYKVTVYSASHRNRAGIADISISVNGIPVFIEIKIDKDKLSKLQIDFLEEYYFTSFVLHYDSKTKTFSETHGKLCSWSVIPTVQGIVKKLNESMAK